MQSDSFTRFLQSELFCAFKGTAKGNPKEDSPQLSTSSRKRKLTASSEYKSHLNQYNVHTYENESMIKSAKLSNESFLARSNVASLSQNTPTFQPNKQQLLDPRNKNPTLIGLENICSQNAFLFSGPEDLCDSESLYCNAPIYDMDAPSESSQPPKRPLHNRVMIDPKWFNNRFIRVVFPDCSEEFISISQKLPIRALVDALLVKKNFNYTSYKMFSIQTNEVQWKINLLPAVKQIINYPFICDHCRQLILTRTSPRSSLMMHELSSELPFRCTSLRAISSKWRHYRIGWHFKRCKLFWHILASPGKTLNW